MDGRALPAGELARYARVSPQTASAHLDRLFKGHLIAVEIQGRHHYYRLRDERVARLLEGLSTLAPPAPAFTPAQRRDAETLRLARTCYGHLAGRLGVCITESMLAAGFMTDGGETFVVTARGEEWLRRMRIDTDALRKTRRPMTRRCLDWSERRHHLAGALGVAMTKRFFELNWIIRVRQSRAVRLSPLGQSALSEELGIELQP
jgi:DNA-binding PadR family transcriptional regulator